MNELEKSGFFVSAVFRNKMPERAALYELRAFQYGLMLGPLSEEATALHDKTLWQVAENNTEYKGIELNPDVVNHIAELALGDKPHYRLNGAAQEMDEAIHGPVIENLSLTPEEVEQAHAVVATVEAERQARQVSHRRPRQELFPTKQPSESVAALQAMIVAREQAHADDRQFEEDSQSLPHRHFPRNWQRLE